MKTFSILGCGWLGLALAKTIQSQYHLKVSTTTPSKDLLFKSMGFNSFLIQNNNFDFLDEFLACDYLLIALPPSKFKNYNAFLKKVLQDSLCKNIGQIIFISSTSVYDKVDGLLNESFYIQNPSSLKVYEAEEIVKQYDVTVLRCAGLMGKNRIAGKYFANSIVLDKNAKVNYAHQKDVVDAILFVIEKKLDGIYNVCAPKHPSKEEVYRANALKYDFDLSVFEDKNNINERIICSKKLMDLGFEYTYDDPLLFEYVVK